MIMVIVVGVLIIAFLCCIVVILLIMRHSTSKPQNAPTAMIQMSEIGALDLDIATAVPIAEHEVNFGHGMAVAKDPTAKKKMAVAL